ncbi:uncharacterized protein [Struthio camelus]|uniref:uncharacterized protein n=1 Tax=Struthio camelus TaxID=8801 RepID=UPI003603B30C
MQGRRPLTPLTARPWPADGEPRRRRWRRRLGSADCRDPAVTAYLCGDFLRKIRRAAAGPGRAARGPSEEAGGGRGEAEACAAAVAAVAVSPRAVDGAVRAFGRQRGWHASGHRQHGGVEHVSFMKERNFCSLVPWAASYLSDPEGYRKPCSSVQYPTSVMREHCGKLEHKVSPSRCTSTPVHAVHLHPEPQGWDQTQRRELELQWDSAPKSGDSWVLNETDEDGGQQHPLARSWKKFRYFTD